MLVMWAASVLAGGAHAAVMATAEAPPPAAGAMTRSLDKALGGDPSSGDRTLDMLMDAQRKGTHRLDETPPARAVPERSANGRLAIQLPPEPFRPMETPVRLPAGRPAVAPLAMPGQVLQVAPSATAPRAQRDWSGAAQGAAGSREAGAGLYGEAKGLPAVDSRLRAWSLAGVAFVKDHLIEILAAWALIALLVAGIKAYSRRI